MAFLPSPQMQGTLQEPLQGSERSHENSALSISFVPGFCELYYKQNNDHI